MKRHNNAAGLVNGICSSPGHEKLKLQKSQCLDYQI